MSDLFAAFLSIGNNGRYFRALQAQVQSPAGVIPFVGAGASAAYNMPLWTQFLNKYADEYQVGPKVATALQDEDYEGAAEILEEAMSSEILKDAISIEYGDEKLMDPETQVGVHLKPISLLLNQLAKNFILTTNYDHVLEKAAEQVGIHDRPTFYGFPQQTYADRIQKQLPLLYKIHGDCDEQSTRVLTRAEYHRAYGSGKEVDLNASVPQILGPMVRSRSLLFVGCSLGPDRTVQAILQLTQNTTKMTHYALLSEIKDDAKRAEKVQQLGQRGIRAIWYPEGQHHFIETILKALVEQTPVPETFSRLEKNNLIYELAEYYPSSLAARGLWRRAGGLARQMPAQPEDATQMWTELLHLIERSRERMILLLERVLEDRHDTLVFEDYLKKLKA